MEGLTEKIKKQRTEIKRKKEELDRILEIEKMKRQEVRHHLNKRRSRSSLHNDNSFLENLHKTRLHRNCAIEAKLLSEGKLKTVEDRDRFWASLVDKSDQIQPGQLHEVYSQQTGPSVSKASSSTHQEDCKAEVEPMISLLGLIREDTEIASAASIRKRSGTVPLQKGRSTASGGSRTRLAKVAAFEEKFKQVEFPKLSAFTLDLSPKKEDSGNLRQRLEYEHRARLRRHNSNQLNRMYGMSLTNQAAAKRTLEKNEELSLALEGPRLADLLPSGQEHQPRLEQLCKTSDDGSNFTRKSSSPVETYVDNNINVKGANSTEGALQGHQTPREEELTSVVSNGDPDNNDDIACISQPLSLDAVMDNNPVIQARRSGVFWYNYGKFLPTIET